MTSLRNITIIALSLLFEMLSNAQNFPSWSWVKQSKGFLSTGYALTINKNKDVFLSCIYQDSVVSIEQYKFTNHGYADALIVKYDSCGNITWTKSFGAEGVEIVTSLVTDSDNNLYIAGIFSSALFRIDNFVVKNTGKNEEVFIMKFDSLGKLSWVNTISGNSTEAYPSIVVNSKNELIVTGSTFSHSIHFGKDTLYNTSGPSIGDIYLIKYDQSGKVIWSKIFGGSESDDYSIIAVDKRDNLYLSGYFTSKEFVIDSIKLLNKSIKNQAFLYYDVFLIKLDNNGKAIWGESFGGDKDDYVNSITVDQSNFVYINGLFNSSTIKFDDSIYTLSRINVFDNFSLKLNPNGNIIWTKVFVDNNQNILSGAIQVDDYYNVYITGQIYFPGIKVDSFQRTNNYGGALTDVFLIKLDSNANLIWGTTIAANFVENVFDMKVIANDELIITGHFASDTLTIGNHTLLYESKGGANYFIAKLGGPIKTSTHEEMIYNTLEIIPNPGNDLVRIMLPDKLVHERNLTLILNDLNGKQINCSYYTDQGKLILDLTAMPQGCYIVTLVGSNERYVQKLIVN
ncbi:MAG: T9SS type A sorting domain-containing protein [Saprospiraceae bacterium]|jgi:hypothetical protein